MDNGKVPYPKVPIQLQIPPACLTDIEADSALRHDVHNTLTKTIDQLLVDLGIPGRADVSLQALNKYHRAYPIRVRVHKRQLRCAPELLVHAHSYVQGLPLNTEQPLHLLDTWLRAANKGQSVAFLAENRQNVVEFLSLVCGEMIKQQPSVLLSAAQVAVIQQSLPSPQGQRPASWLLPIFRQALDLRISLADRQTIAHVLDQGIVEERTPADAAAQADVAESLVAALRPATVEIRIPRAYLHALTLADAATERDTFTLLRDGLFHELGLTFPDFRFVPADNLKPGTFAFKINHVTTLPYVGLRLDQRLVNAYPETLQKIGVQAQPAVNPTNWDGASIIDVTDADSVRENGYWIWDPVEYLVLALSSSLRAYGAALIDTQVVQNQLSELAQIHPALTQAVQKKITLAQLARVERALVAEGLSIRNLREILERLLDYDYIVTDPRAYLIFDDRIAFLVPPDEATLAATPNLTRFVRMGMKRTISHRATANQSSSTLATYLIDKDFEALFYEELAQGTISQTFRQRVLDAVEEEFHLEPLPPTPPNILVSQMLRDPFRAITATEFPRLRIWAFEELSANVPISPVTKIAP